VQVIIRRIVLHRAEAMTRAPPLPKTNGKASARQSWLPLFAHREF